VTRARGRGGGLKKEKSKEVEGGKQRKGREEENFQAPSSSRCLQPARRAMGETKSDGKRGDVGTVKGE